MTMGAQMIKPVTEFLLDFYVATHFEATRYITSVFFSASAVLNVDDEGFHIVIRSFHILLTHGRA